MAIKNVGLILFVLVFSSTLSAQKKALSKPSSVSIKPKIEPPILQVVDGSLRFSDANGNKAIDASELSHLEFSLKNSGFGDGLNLVAKLQSTGTTQGIRLDSKINLERVPKSGTTTYRIPIQSDMNTAQGKLSINVVVEEPNGFNPPPFSLDIETRAFQAPLVKVADFSLSGDGVLKPMSKFDLQILVQNTGQGVAKDVSLSFKLPENVLLLEGEEAQRISQLQPGETRSLKFGVIINAKYNLSTVPVSLSIRESFGKYAENWSQAFAMNQQMAAPRKLVVEAQAQEKINIEEASLKSDVDRNIPKTPKRNPNRLALVIGNEDYASRASGLSKAINVDYAENDAVIFAEYLKQSFGLDEGHIKLLRNATSGEMRSGLDWLANLTRATG
ncbi:MAG: caspase family protein, partial [Flavobacteriales bacterium]